MRGREYICYSCGSKINNGAHLQADFGKDVVECTDCYVKDICANRIFYCDRCGDDFIGDGKGASVTAGEQLCPICNKLKNKEN